MPIKEKIIDRILKKKKFLDSFRPFNTLQLNKLHEDFIIEYAHNSTAIEGNTLTLNETKLILQDGITIGGKSLREHLDVTNQKEAFLWIESLIKENREIKESDILTLHRITLKGISDYWAGRYKESENRIIGSKLKTTPPYKVHIEMENLVYILNHNPSKLDDIALSAFAHHEFVKIHPFVDGNGRTARLLCNLILMKKGYPPIILNKFERKKYFDSLEKAHFGNNSPFFSFIEKKVEESLILYLNVFSKTTEKNSLKSLFELSKQTTYSQEYLSLLARRGIIPAVKINNVWHTSEEELKKYADSLNK